MVKNEVMFADRTEAGIELAKKLLRFIDASPIVLALPRGGVPVGYEIAKQLDAPLDVIAIRKIGHPSSQEFAIGAVNDEGHIILNEEATKDVDAEHIKKTADREKTEAARRSREYRSGKPPLELHDKTVILVDDGMATGMSMKLAVRTLHQHSPRSIIVAIPVAPEDAVEELKKMQVEVITLEPPEKFRGTVGGHYINFPQLKDDEVIRLLKAAKQ